jgi:hypothetical protein
MRSSTTLFHCENCNQVTGSFAPEQIFCSACAEKMALEPTESEKKLDNQTFVCHIHTRGKKQSQIDK